MHTTETNWLDAEIRAYWDERSGSYSRSIRGELGDERRQPWRRALARICAPLVEQQGAQAGETTRPLRVLDLGCGPGFFTVLFAEAGCKVSAVDSSLGMIERARANVEEAVPGAQVRFECGDVASLPFADGEFDLAVSRNLTWLLRNPEETYAEWLRVLRPGGALAIFDANWYRYLVDPKLAAERVHDQQGHRIEEWHEDELATPDEEKRCEEIAAELPLTPIVRPAWDLEVLARLGATKVQADTEAWRELWTPSEHAFYQTSPLFMVTAFRQVP